MATRWETVVGVEVSGVVCGVGHSAKETAVQLHYYVDTRTCRRIFYFCGFLFFNTTLDRVNLSG